jgi:phosphoadenosine phosphosulfate reductase
VTFEEIKAQLEKYKAEGKQLFTSSSFQSHSLVMLHMISRIDNSIPVYFINTGYHFPETMQFRDFITESFNAKYASIYDLKYPSICRLILRAGCYLLLIRIIAAT